MTGGSRLALFMSRREVTDPADGQFQRQELDAAYHGFFECFNSKLFFEAHEVLEKLWLPNRQKPNGSFYKGLIQLAGAFVHIQKSRPGPAAALLKLARTNLSNYPSVHERLDTASVLRLIEHWLKRVEPGLGAEPTTSPDDYPALRLLQATEADAGGAGRR